MSRQECEALLMGPGAAYGDFLVRSSQTESGSYSLSVRMHNELGASGLPIKHIRIKQGANGRWSLSVKNPTHDSFATVVDLIGYYQSKGEFSGIRLLRPAQTGSGAQDFKCFKCGCVLKAGEKFCGQCGQVQQQQQQQQQQVIQQPAMQMQPVQPVMQLMPQMMMSPQQQQQQKYTAPPVQRMVS